MEDVVWLPVWPEGFGKNGVRGRENTGSEKASGVCELLVSPSCGGLYSFAW